LFIGYLTKTSKRKFLYNKLIYSLQIMVIGNDAFMKILFSFLFYYLLAIQLSGCASGRVPQDGLSMADVYHKAMQQSNGETLGKTRDEVKQYLVAFNGNNQLTPYTRNAENEINNLFPLLLNPQLVMYVYPHLAGSDEAPIPGYSTAFFLYERNHYALPGELKLAN
jgi:conjugative transfer region lipoprotein (TIGR03751 family)